MRLVFVGWLVLVGLAAGGCASGTNDQSVEAGEPSAATAAPTPEPTPEPTGAPTTAPEPTATTVPAPEPTPTIEPTPTAEPTPVELRADGVGPVTFGEPAATVVPELVAIFGEPISDESWTGQSPWGTVGQPAPGDPPATLRVVAWDGLTGYFIDAPLFRDDGVLHLTGWSATGGSVPPLATTEGIVVGSALAQLQSVRPDAAPVVSVCFERWFAHLGGPISINGVDSDMIAVFADIPTPDPVPGDTSGIALPAGADNAVITEIYGGKGQPLC